MKTFNEKMINVYGRFDTLEGMLTLYHSASGIEVEMVGGTLKILLHSTGKSYMRVFVDGEEEGERLAVFEGENEYVLVSGIEAGRHSVRIVKATEESEAIWTVKELIADSFVEPPEKPSFKMEFIGDSITAGYGVLGQTHDTYSVDNSDSTKSYAYLTAQALRVNYSIIGWSGICTKAYQFVPNLNMTQLYSQVSNRNTTPYEKGFDADVVIVNLGTNDTAYLFSEKGKEYGEQFPIDYRLFLSMVRAKNPRAHIICLYGMMASDEVISGGIQAAIKALGDEKIVYNPFVFVSNFSGANGHPSAEAQKGYAEGLAEYVKTLRLE